MTSYESYGGNQLADDASAEIWPEATEPIKNPITHNRFYGRPLTEELHDEVEEILREHSIVERLTTARRTRLGRIAVDIPIERFHPITESVAWLPQKRGYY